MATTACEAAAGVQQHGHHFRRAVFLPTAVSIVIRQFLEEDHTECAEGSVLGTLQGVS